MEAMKTTPAPPTTNAWAAAKVKLLWRVSLQRASQTNEALYWVQDWEEWRDVLDRAETCRPDDAQGEQG